MNRVRAFFVEEATECLGALRSALATEVPDRDELYSAARRLRGSAQVARFGGVAREAEALEQVLREAASGPLGSDRVGAAEAAVASLEDRITAVREGRIEQDAREHMTDEQTGTGPGTGPESAGDEVVTGVVPIDTLEYRGASALEKAGTLREPLENAILEGEPPGGILDELFGLIRLGTK